MPNLTLTIIDKTGAPLPGVVVRLYGGLAEFGTDPRAAASSRGAVTWTRPVSGFGGTLWNAWQKFVASDVAGITWEEFRLEAPQHNPDLRATEGLLQVDATYHLPENRVYADMAGSAPGIVWDRPLAGFGGSDWACWQRFVQGKVVGLSWPAFEEAVAAVNPDLGRTRGFQADRTYLLPRNSGQEEYYRAAFTPVEGVVEFAGLAPGVYRAEIGADGFLRAVREFELTVDYAETVTLIWLSFEAERGEEAFIRPSGRDFALNGRTFRFFGVNLRGLAHYGLSAPVVGANAEQELAAAREMGARVVRIFLPHCQVSPEDTLDRLKGLLKLIDRMDMYLIVALANLYGDVEFRVPGDDAYYTHEPIGESRKLLSIDWFREGYKNAYWNFVKTIVSDQEVRTNPRIMAYNIGNELKAESRGEKYNLGHADLLITFMHAMARQIKTWDGRNHMVTTGMISTRHAHMWGNEQQRKDLYNHPDLDFITNHAYHGDDDDNTSKEQEYAASSRENDGDLVFKLRQPKPVLIEEAGFEYIGDRRDRSKWVSDEMDKLLNEQGAAGYMPWGFMSSGNNGDGDEKCGMDRRFHGDDWESLKAIYQNWANHFAATSRPASAPIARPSDAQQVYARVEVNLRAEPGLQAARVDKLPAGTIVALQGDSRRADNLVWWPVRATLAGGRAVAGWVAQLSPANDILLAGI